MSRDDERGKVEKILALTLDRLGFESYTSNLTGHVAFGSPLISCGFNFFVCKVEIMLSQMIDGRI